MLSLLARAYRVMFTKRARWLLILNVIALYAVSMLDLVGVAAILPLAELAMGKNTDSGYLKLISDALGNPERTQLTVIMAAILVAAFAFKALFSLTVKWWSSGFIFGEQVRTSTRLMRTYLEEPYEQHRRREVPSILNSVSDATSTAYASVVNAVMAVVGEGLTILLIMILLIMTMPGPSLFAIGYFIVSVSILQLALARANRSLGAQLMNSIRHQWKTSLDAVSGFREARIHGVTNRFLERYRLARVRNTQQVRRLMLLTDLPKYAMEIIFIVGIAAVLVVVVMTAHGNDTITSITLFAAASVRILPSFIRLVSSLGAIRAGEKAVCIVLDQIEAASTPASGLGETEYPHLAAEHDHDQGQIVRVAEPDCPISLGIDAVSFRYVDGSEDVLKNVSLTIPAGTSIALCGSSGSGKTTLVDNILGLLEPRSGRILANGTDIRKNLRGWYASIGYVPQDVYILNGTVAENVAFGYLGHDIDRDRVEQCLRQAHVFDAVCEMPNGIDSHLGEGGARISGGQRQRIGIARALYSNPSLLILDEATSALDNETESRITSTIESLNGELTVIIVAHRLSTVKNVDQLAFMEHGEVTSIGTFSEVRDQNPAFARLVELGSLK
ncbi:ABC transporter ATP-binding protein [Devriesea agamarum]|uniref:ABC transporter ATP-binding protein n=1 Tax=Devriesea agamarum TaxID=472569 RepID=UPI00071E14F3|nr:ABC transporter ATP-binding protein [Devriesea agamarum]